MYFNFGSSNSENAHNFKGAFTSVITGFMDETARVSNLLAPDLTDAEKQALIDGYVQDQVKRN